MTDAGSRNIPRDRDGREEMLTLLQEARRHLELYQKERSEKVAIVGMAGRFPGAEDIDAFWRLLDEGRSGLVPVSEAELSDAGVPPEVSGRPEYVRVWGGFDDPTGFDAGFFGYAPREAEVLDPQQRVFLECAWSALEHAGYDCRSYPGQIGVYAGGALTHYHARLLSNARLRETVDPLQAILSNVNGMVAARTAFHLDLKGPSVGVQTTCSTSLVAVHQAARSLLAGECDMALAGGVAVSQPEPVGYLYEAEGIGSPDGQCRPFDAAAQGTLFTNGVGAVVLKRLSDARADGDTIYAVILGSAVNNDGAGKVGLTAPGVAGQVAVLEAALASAGVPPSSIGYVEAHGTATALGDPIELAALNRVYGPAFRDQGGACGLGSVKGNIGHLDAAAGVAGLIKTILALHRARLPASLNFDRPNPGCDFAGGPFEVVAESCPWPASPDRPRRAAVSSFGMGGTNAHVILEEAPRMPAPADDDSPQLLPISAQTSGALAAMAADLAQVLSEESDHALADVAFTLQVGRRPMKKRMVCLARDAAKAAATLARGEGPDLADGGPLPGAPSLAFLFPGQGAQHPGMARALHAREPAFRQAFDACIERIPAGADLARLLLGPQDADPASLNRTECTQPALFVVEYALAQMWLDKGLRPRAFLGHSIGEYVAACLAGVFSLEDALHVVCARGRLMQACAPGGMLSVMLSEAEARTILSGEVELAAVNGPRNCVLAGPRAAIDALAERFERSGLGCRPLKTSHAFHSAMVEPALAEFASVLAAVSLNAPAIDIVSNVTGDWLTAAQATDRGYWVEHMRRPVLFGPGLARLMDLPMPLLLEVGPGSTLTRLARQQLHDDARALASLPDPGSEGDAADHALLAFGQLWIAGLDVDWRQLHRGGPRRRVGLPGYHFERVSYRLPSSPIAPSGGSATAPREALSDWFYQPVWTRKPLAVSDGDGSVHPARWLLLGGATAMAALGPVPEGIEVVVAEAGEAFSAEGGVYTIDPRDPDHYRALIAELEARGQVVDEIVNGFGLDPECGADGGFMTTLSLARALKSQADEARVLRRGRLTVLGREMHEVCGGEDVDADAAMVHGLTRVLEQELDGVACRCIDLPALEPGVPVAGLGAALRSPWAPGATVSALRGGFHWTLGHASAPLAEPSQVPMLKAQVTYLVTGDLTEGLGLIYARALVKELGAKVILLGRPGLPPAEEWDRWLALHSPQHAVSQLILDLREIGTPGEDYVVYSGNISDIEWVRRILHDGQLRLGPVQGIFHTAGMGDQYHCPLELAGPENWNGLFTAKIGAVRTLAAVVGVTAAEFVLVQSSLSTILGGPGFAAYAAANSFLDAFVEARRHERPVWQAINWDVCRPFANRAENGPPLAAAFDPDEVWRITRAVLAHPQLSRVVVTSVDLDRRMASAMAPAAASTASPASATVQGRLGVSATYVAPRDSYEEAVATVMGELLGIGQVGVDDNFFELGGHSLLAIQVVSRLRKTYDIELPMRTLLFEAPTAAGLAHVVRGSVEAAGLELDTVATLLEGIEAGVQLTTAH